MTETVRVKAVNENQCQMCMPLGGVAAFKGIENAMVLVHGSQGCSTYMRLSNVEHYNEPVDIASSSLNEKQTIYGGEENLRKAMDNVIRVYQPKVIGILTTCLAETIGEDIERIVQKYQEDKQTDVDIIPVSTPSYGGGQAEGFWAGILEQIRYYARATEGHDRINVIIPHISPADIREIKRMMELMGVSYTLIPDYSITLDRPYGGIYLKIPPGGTKTEDIARMAGAPLTIQFGMTCPEALSPGFFLEKEFGVPLLNLPLPVGLENTDQFLATLRKISGHEIPDELALERGWLLDGMADSHKYNADGSPVIYGEPEQVYAFTILCIENGAYPSVIACGSKNSQLVKKIQHILRDLPVEPVIIEEADFDDIRRATRKQGSNIGIGHSGGKFLTEHEDIPIVRIGFPIHDRIGGQRILSAGYRGTLTFLDRFTNTLLEKKYTTYRKQRKEEILGDV